MNSSFSKMIEKSRKLGCTSNSVIKLFTYLSSYPEIYSLGVATNCTLYKFDHPVCYIFFGSRSIQIWDEDQSGNECTMFNKLMSNSTLKSRVKLVAKKSSDFPIQKLLLTTDADVLTFLNDIKTL